MKRTNSESISIRSLALLRSGHRKVIVMLGTSPTTRGGISTVVESYRQAGLFERWSIVYISTHVDGSYFQKTATALRAIIRFAGLLARQQVLLVHVLSAAYASVWRKTVFILLSLIGNCPVIFHLHGGRFPEFYERCGPIKRKVVGFVLDHAAHIIVLTDQWKVELQKITSNPHITPIANAVSDEYLIAAECNQRDRWQVLFLGAIKKEKGVFDLLEAFALVVQDLPQARLVFAGQGHVDELVAYAMRLGISGSVEARGWVAGKAKAQLLCSSAILCLPSYAEALPMVVLEAMTTGTAVVATAVGGIPDVIEDGVNGVLVKPGDPNHLATAIKALLEDEGLRERMGHAARKRALEDYSLNTVVPALEKVYREVTDDRGVRGRA